jgi:hypothetical protein
MKKRLVLVLILGANVVGIGAHAGSIYPEHAGMITTIESGCGIGVRRGPYGGCGPVYPNYYSDYYKGYYRGYYRGYWTGYRDGYVDGSVPSLMVDQGACSGRRMYRVCDAYLTCWIACY